MMNVIERCYLAGPMRGRALFNFPAFDAAAADLRERGLEVISPAEIDREMGFDPEVHDESYFGDLSILIRQDVNAVLATDAVVLLPGWEGSTGARAEIAVARWAGREVLLYPDLMPLGQECILEEAGRITRGDRQAAYGPPDEDFRRVAGMWTALKGVPFTARDVAAFMICLKLSRERHQQKRDNWVDVAGYARCGSLCGVNEE